MPILDAVIQWANHDLEDWQADAVRRILTQENLTERDISELLLMLKSKHGLTQATDVVPTPVTFKDTGVSGAAGKTEPVVLEAIENLSNVNAIPDGSSLPLGATGLTLIYGDNATGKSGYARVLKKACKARHEEPIHPNVFAGTPSRPASATFSVSIGNSKRKIDWVNNEQSSDILSNICVFDSKCSRITVDDENEVSYVPYGGDVFPKLVRLMQELHKRLEQEKPIPIPPTSGDIPADTTALQFLATLNERTTAAEIDAATAWTQESQQELEQKTRDVAKADAEDPAKRASAIRNMKDRITEFTTKIKEIDSSLSLEKEEILRRQINELQICRNAFYISSQESFDFAMEPLSGVGENEWHELYKAAKEYSVKFAYQGKEFPQTGDGSLCVLCMQPLSEEAKSRFRRFKEFAEHTTRQKKEEAEQRLKESLKKLEDLDFGITESYKDVLAEISNRNEDCANRLKDYVGKMLARKMSMSAMGTGHSPVDIPPMALSPLSEIQKVIEALESEAQALAKLSVPENLNASKQQKTKLEARKKLSERKFEILTYLAALKTAKKYDNAIGETDHRAVTRKGKEIISNALTPSFEACLSTEFKNLGIPLHMKLDHCGREGELKYKLKLDNYQLPRKTAITEILSEGEERVVAIASFLAELNACGHTNPIVFDDPVSSLDHIWREKVAKRLIDEARHRQVIVFTHDIVFATDIKNQAEDFGVKLTERNVCRCGRNPGSVELDSPWIAGSTHERLTALRRKLNTAKTVYNTKKDYEYAESVADLYSRLRATCERAVEDIVFSGTVLRHRDYIPINQNFKKVLALDAAACDVLINLHNKCSKITEAHDPSRARNAPVPNPDEIAADIRVLEDWVANIRAKQKALA
jgi:hypothetical protein